jgi:hypothetical protein
MDTGLLVFIFGVCGLITYFIVWTKRAYPLYALRKIKRIKRKQHSELLRLEGRNIVNDMRQYPLLFIDDVAENQKRRNAKSQWRKGRRIDGLLENWITSDSNKIFYLRTVRKLHFNVIRVCLAQFLSERILLLRSSLVQSIEKRVLSYLCDLLDPTEVDEEYALANLVRITLEEDY